MKKSYNQIQKNYMIAKAKLEALEEQKREVDRQYIAAHNIVNSDGSIPELSWMIEDDDTADNAIEECGKIVEASGLWAKILQAREELKQAEDKLIEFGLSIMPYPEEREILREAVKKDYTARKKVIDLTFRLDVRTVTT